jgi:hypothetical protein
MIAVFAAFLCYHGKVRAGTCVGWLAATEGPDLMTNFGTGVEPSG